MRSPGHRDNILDRWHKKVNVGLAWDRYNFVAYLHFEGGFVEYEMLPTMEDDVLYIGGRTRHGMEFRSARDLGVQVYYDPPPHPLKAGQLSRTYCYSRGLQVASLREPLSGTAFWPTDSFNTTRSPCPDPYDVPDTSPAPRSHDQANAHWEEAYLASMGMPRQPIVVPWVTARKWHTAGELFSVEADLKDIVSKHGDGVYTVWLWGKLGGKDLVISEYSIFYGIEPPTTYSVSKETSP